MLEWEECKSILEDEAYWEKLKCHVRLSRACQCRQVTQQEPHGIPVMGSENHANDTAEETMLPDATTCQRSKRETSKSKTVLNNISKSTALDSQMPMKGSSTWLPIFIFMVVVWHRQRMRVNVVDRCWEVACFDVRNRILQCGHFSCQSLHLFHYLLHDQRLDSDICREGLIGHC
uniref:Uncharacterized protein n=1 Tax=Romanomermis culicivorax TaxID=13658 RepID=A0A915KIS1_ROMCU